MKTKKSPSKPKGAVRGHTTLLRANSMRVGGKENTKAFPNIQLNLVPQIDIKQYDIVEHEHEINIEKAQLQDKIAERSPQTQKDEAFFLPFYEVKVYGLPEGFF